MPTTTPHAQAASSPAAAAATTDATAEATAAAATPLAPARRDLAPLLLAPAVMLAALPWMSTPTWVTLTVAGLSMGMMIFIMASGLTLVFGLMGVLNFGHGAFIAVGAYAAALVLLRLRGWLELDALAPNLAALGLAVLAALAVTALLALLVERLVVMPVYGQPLKQILATMGALIVAEQAIAAFWGPEPLALPLPAALRGSLFVGDAAIETYRLLAVAVGLAVFALLVLVLGRTRIGLLIRAGVENGAMVEALGYRIRRLFAAVFAAGAALAGLGGVLWGLYKETLVAQMGGDVMVLTFIVVVIGGLGSVGGCFIGALLVALVGNYAGFLAPKAALVSDIVLMIAILLWRPAGLYAREDH